MKTRATLLLAAIVAANTAAADSHSFDRKAWREDYSTPASAGCAAAGYSPATRIAFSLPFESLTGFRMEADGISRAFRSGTIVVGEIRVGLVRIPRFRPAEYPALCLATWPALDEMDVAWVKALADRLAAFRTQHVDAALVDIGGDGGGNDLGDWAARLFTTSDVRSAPLLMHTGPLGAQYMDEPRIPQQPRPRRCSQRACATAGSRERWVCERSVWAVARWSRTRPSRYRTRISRFAFRIACACAPTAATRSQALHLICLCCRRRKRVGERAPRACFQ